MKQKGTYQEMLPCGGKLVVSSENWYIQYFFSGPDQRYKGTFKNIDGNLLENYISAFEKNFLEFNSLKTALPGDGEFSKNGEMGMTIRIGKFAEGVCLVSYHMPVNNKERLKTIIDGYRYASERAPKIQQLLATLA